MDTSISSLFRIGAVLYNKYLRESGFDPIEVPSLLQPQKGLIHPLHLQPSLEKVLLRGKTVFPRRDARLCLLVKGTLASDSDVVNVLTVNRSLHDSEIYQLLKELTPLRSLKLLSTSSLPTCYTATDNDLARADIICIPAFELEALLADDDSAVTAVTGLWKDRLANSRIVLIPFSRLPNSALTGIFSVDSSIMPKFLKERLDNHPVHQEIANELKESEDRGTLVTCVARNYGMITYKRKVADSPSLTSATLRQYGAIPPPTSVDRIWPLEDAAPGIYDRTKIEPSFNLEELLADANGLFVARSDALTNLNWARTARAVWTAGLSTWRKLCASGIWVSGTTDGLGEAELAGIEPFVPIKRWIKITHTSSPSVGGDDTVCTYKITPAKAFPDLSKTTHFYWKSGSLFQAALEDFPSIRSGWHSCGPGLTLEEVSKVIPKERLSIFLTHRDWKRQIVHEKLAKAS